MIIQFLARLFLKKKLGGIVIAKTLTFSNISVITEDIYLKLRLVVDYPKGEPIPLGWVILKFFFDIVMPRFLLRLF